jgi:hypothetical protein
VDAKDDRSIITPRNSSTPRAWAPPGNYVFVREEHGIVGQPLRLPTALAGEERALQIQRIDEQDAKEIIKRS